MDAFPQLRVRTEFSFTRKAYGPLAKIVDRLKALGAPAAGMVNAGGGTWGQAKFEPLALAAGIQPLFGAEFAIKTAIGRPIAWVLGQTLPDLYRFASHNPSTASQFASAKGLIRFSGSALEDPECFDYVDIGPRSPLAQWKAMNLSRRTGKPLALVSDNLCPGQEDLDLMRVVVDRESSGVQWLANPAELHSAMLQVPKPEFEMAVRSAHEIAERLSGIRIPKAPIIRVDGDLPALCERGKQSRLKRGHIREWTQEYEARLQRELELIKQKEFESYFLVVSDLVRWAKARMLVGPARGSSAGSLVCYLIEITEVDPLKHNLLFERFIDVNRSDLPDIDVDFSDTRRDMVFDYLAETYGRDRVARLGNVNTLKPASVLSLIARRLDIPYRDLDSVRNVLVEHSSGDSRYGKALEDTLTQTAPGRAFVAKYPPISRLTEIEGHATHSGVHAAGVIVCNEPLTNFCTVIDGVAQIDKPDSEYLNMLKIDALGLRTLGVIEDSGCVTAEELYSLTLDDPKVLDIFNQRRMAGIFQFEGAAQRSVAYDVRFDSFRQLDHVTALARPGPLGGGASQRYIERAAGREAVAFRHDTMRDYLGDTLGVVLYQEQVMRIVRELGGFSWEKTSTIRKAMSGRKGSEFFDRMRDDFIVGAAERGIDEAAALEIWDEIFNFGAWGMNMSHTVSYAIISYWCGWMKAYHPLEFAAATLRSAKNDEQVLDLLRELKAEGVGYVALDPDVSEVNWSVKNGRLVGGIQNAEGYGPAKAKLYVDARNAGTLTPKQRERLAAAEVKFADLSPIHTAFGEYYTHPEDNGIRKGWVVREIAELGDNEEAVFICRVVEKKQRDMNEELLIKRRHGRRINGQTLFLDLKVVDDSTSVPLIVRIDRHDWLHIGRKIAERAHEGKDCFLVRGRKLRNLPMVAAYNVRCLTNSRMMDDEAQGAEAVGLDAHAPAARVLASTN